MIDGITNSGAIPTLERLVQFAAGRHRIITHNIANLSTPNFRPVNVSVDAFQESLADAVDARRAGAGGRGDTLGLTDTDEIVFERDRMRLNPQPEGNNILFHDGNDRSLERLMQDLVENFMVFRQASELLRSRFEILNTAIRERI